MKFDSLSPPTPPTPQQLIELNDVLFSAMELQRLYAALARHPRVLITPGSVEIFESCREQLGQDAAVLTTELESLHLLGQSAPLAEAGEGTSADGTVRSPQLAALSDIEPADSQKSVFDTVKKAFRHEDFLREQLNFSLTSAQERGHRKLEMQLKMILLSANQRCRLLEDRYGFARSKSVFVQGLRKQTTRFLSRLQGEERRDID
jgi:hypothetical protein